MTKATRNVPALFGWREVKEALASGCVAALFSLDALNTDDDHHPFQLLHFQPEACRGTVALATMFHTDYLLKFFSCGQEMSSHPPFAQRRIEDGMLKRLPSRIRDAISVNNGANRSARKNDVSVAHRFWLEAGTLPHCSTQTTTHITEVYGKQQMCVKKHLLRRNPVTGEMEDSPEDDATGETTEAQFAHNFTRYYDQIAEAFPEFALLREFSKIVAATRSLTELAINAQAQLKHLDNHPEKNKMIASQEKSLRDQLKNVSLHASNEQVKILVDSLNVSSSSVRTMLTNRSYRAVATTLIERELNSAKDVHRKVLEGLRTAGLRVDGDIAERVKSQMAEKFSTRPSKDYACEWAPAVFCRTSVVTAPPQGEEVDTSVYRVYGGVHLSPRMQQLAVTPPANSSYVVTSTNALGGQRANGFVNSNATRIDNLANQNRFFFQNQANIAQNNANLSRSRHAFFNNYNTPGRQIDQQNFTRVYQSRDVPVQRYWDGRGNRAAEAGKYWSPITPTDNNSGKQRFCSFCSVLCATSL